MGDIEKYGTGFRRVKNWIKDYPEMKFEFNSLNGFIKVNILNVPVNVPVNVPLNEPVNVPVNVPVNKRQNDIIEEIKSNNRITQKELADKYRVNRETIKRDLNKLKKLGLVRRVGSDKTGYWEVITK